MNLMKFQSLYIQADLWWAWNEREIRLYHDFCLLLCLYNNHRIRPDLAPNDETAL